jgi:hypothetical protein
VKIHVGTADGKIIDVSKDITRGSVTRVRKAPSSFEFDLLNQSRKYDGVFDSMDRVVIYLRRVREVLAISGYLDSVPVFAAKSGNIHLSGTCTLKRLQQFVWDPHTAAAAELFSQADVTNRQDLTDGGLAQRTIDLLNTVAGWPKEQIHIGAVPGKWFDKIKSVSEKLVAEAEKAAAMAAVGSGSYVEGNNQITSGLATVGGRVVPSLSGRATQFGGGPLTNPPTPDDPGAHGGFALTGERYPHYQDLYYCAMRWPYQRMDAGRGDDIRPIPGVNVAEEMAFWRNRKILVVNPENQKAVVVRAADWGPATWTGNAIDLSPMAMRALTGSMFGSCDGVHIAFAPDDAKIGPTDINATSASAQQGQNLSDAGVKASDWGDPGSERYEQENIVSITAGGVTVRVNRKATARFSGFLNDLSKIYKLDQAHTCGYVKRPITGGTGWSNHAYGGAIDVNWDRNPYGARSNPHQFDDAQVRYLAHKWGLWWGGDYDGNSGIDYMHFEVAEAPRSPSRAMTYSQPGIESGAGANPLIPNSGAANTPSTGGTGSGTTETNVADALFNVYQWIGGADFGGELLTGIRSLMNDEPLLQTVSSYMDSAMRDYCSAPNGDFIGWFPDYFGWWGTAGKMVIEPIEILQDFAVAKSDEYLKTHIFVMGATTGIEGEGDASSIVQQLGTAGIASVEMPELMAALFNTDSRLFADGGKSFLNRYGARPHSEYMNNVSGHLQEFFFAVFHFMDNWAKQYTASLPLTFMPELFPGMLACFPVYGVQAYVDSVTHNFDLTDGGGGFTTQPNLISWSTIGASKRAIKGLPLGAPL